MKLAIYPGSFDPITNGHLDIIERAARIFDRLVVAVAFNSAKQGLFSIEERVDFIRETVKDMPGVEVATFSGLLIDYAQERGAAAIIRGLRAVTDFDYEYAMHQMNQEMSPDIETLFLVASKEFSYLSSTIIKEFARYGRPVANFAPRVVSEALLLRFGHKDGD